MGVAVLSRRAGEARESALARAGALPWLVGLVTGSFLVRTIGGWLRATPLYFSDEYLYAELGRSLAETGRPLVRGASASFPALLQPILTAPAWLIDDVGLAYHAVQVIGALAMSLAAVPVFLLARRLGLGQRLALAFAALALVVPDLLYSGWVVAEPFAYPLALGAVAAGTAALASPGRRIQLLFVALAALAAFARAQFVVLPLCFLAAILLVGARERRLRACLREQLLPLGLFAAPLLGAFVLGPASVLGLYGGALDARVDPIQLLERAGANAMILLYASGWILVPGALLGMGLALVRPRSRTELGFAALVLPLALALLAEAALFGDVEHVQERYVFYLVPLIVLGFGLYASRGWPLRLHHGLLACGLVVVSAQVPLAGFTAAEGKAHSAFLLAASRLEEALGGEAAGSMAIAALAALLSLGAVVAVACRGRIALVLPLAAALAACAAASTGAALFDHRNSALVRASVLPADPSWVDRAGFEHVTLVRSLGGRRTETLEQLFWNRSVDRVVLFPGAWQLDHYGSERVRIGRDGTLFLADEPATGPLLVDGYAATVRLRGARRVSSSQSYELWRPDGRPRLALYVRGRYYDGWLSPAGSIAVWPRPGRDRVVGKLRFELRAPPGAGASTVVFGRERVRVPATGSVAVELLACSRGPWELSFRSTLRGFLGGRMVSVQSTEPVFRPDAAACAGVPTQQPAGPAPAVAA